MLKNNKGFTVIELIMSFLFSSILAITLFSVIVAYRGKQTDSTISTELLAFKSHLIMDIQEDIELKGLRDVTYCEGAENTIVPRCVIMSFNDSTSKTFQILSDDKVDIITNNDGTESQFFYKIPFVVYGDIRYDIPDAANIYIDDDYILETTGLEDGIESGTKLYKINFNLKHNDLDENVNISIVASGSLATSSSEGPYKVYNIGDVVYIQLNDSYQRQFRVIQFSNSYKNNLTLLYDDVYDSNLVLDSTDYNIIENISNRYESSKIRSKVHALEVAWNNADVVRLITAEEVSRIAALCPQYRGADSPEIGINLAPDWLTNKDYWTMSEKVLTGDDNGKKVWYVKGSSKTLSFDYVNASHTLRPVIIVQKSYVANR